VKDYTPKNELEKKVYVKLNRTIKQVGEDIESFNHNTAIASLMELLNLLYKDEQNLSFEFLNFVTYKYTQLISPFIPHLAEEIYEGYNEKDSIFLTSWPEYDKENLQDEKITIVIQINGKVRDRLEIEKDSTQDDVLKEALLNPTVKKYLKDGKLEKNIYVPNRLINLIIKE